MDILITILYGACTVFVLFLTVMFSISVYDLLDQYSLNKMFLYSIVFIVICYIIGNFVKNIL
jgi:hypothetical protein